MFTKSNFENREELVKYINSKSLTERRTYAKEHGLADGKSETIADYAIANEAVTIAPEVVAIEETATIENVAVEIVDVAPQPTSEVTMVESEVTNVPSDEQLAKVAKHYNALVRTLDEKLNVVRGLVSKLSFMDGQTLLTTLSTLHPSECATFSIDTVESLATISQPIDTRKMALDAYDSGAFKLDGQPLTKELVSLALTAKVTPHEKTQQQIDALLASESWAQAVEFFDVAKSRLQLLVSTVTGAELICVFDVRNNVVKAKAKGNSTSANAAVRSNVHKSDRIVVSGLDIWKKAGNGKMHLATGQNNEWTIEVMDNTGSVLTMFDQTKGISPSKATVLGYQRLTTPNSNVSSNKFWEVESLYV